MDGKMNLGELEFKAEDFPECDQVDTDGDLSRSCAIRANERLRERLEKAKEVTGYMHSDGYFILDSSPQNGDTHSARLVCIEEVGK